MAPSPRGRRARCALVGLLAAVLASAVAPVPAAGADPEDAPETRISGGPRDQITPDHPVTLTPRPTVELSASEPATFNCAVNAKRVPCQAGVTVLPKLKPGPQVFVAQAVDPDGNFDATPATLTFFVPVDLKPGHGGFWKKVKSRASYDGDYVATTRKGALLKLGRVRGVRELRLYAPIGPRLGKLAIRVGKGPWTKVRLKSPTTQRLHVFEVRGPDAPPLTGAIRLKVLKVPSGGAVAVDAIVAR